MNGATAKRNLAHSFGLVSIVGSCSGYRIARRGSFGLSCIELDDLREDVRHEHANSDSKQSASTLGGVESILKSVEAVEANKRKCDQKHHFL